MATLIFSDASVVVNSVDLSDHVASVTVNYEAEQQDDTAMGDDTRSNKPGLYNWTIDVEFHQDYAASEVDATLFSLVGADFPIVVKPTSAAVSSTNPSYSANATLSSYQPMGGSVGDLEMAPSTFVPAKGASGSATLTRATS